MKQQNLLFTFLPWIIFSSGLTTFTDSALIALVLNIVISRRELMRGFVLEIGSIIFFAAMFVLGLLLPQGDAFTQHPNLWGNLAMSTIMLGSVALNKPFTKQYTDQGTHKIHMHLSIIWGVLLLLSTVVSALHAYFGFSNAVATLATVVAIYAGIKANSLYPKWVIENLKKRKMLETKNNAFLKNNHAPVYDELNVDHLEVMGEIPDDLLGVYMRNGPNPEFPPITYAYPFDGDGMIHAIHIADGKARYQNRYVETNDLLAERKAGKALYGGFMLPLPIDPKYVGENAVPFKDGAFIHIIKHAGKYLAMHEADAAYEMNIKLETIGLWTPSGSVEPIKVSAHTRLCPKTGDLWLINYDIIPPFLTVYKIDNTGKVQFKKDIDKQYPTMMHDFVLTENYVVFYDCPAVFDPKKITSGNDVLSWKPELGVRIGIMSRQTGDMKWLQTEPFFVFHFANAYEKDNDIIVDFVRHHDLKFSENKEKRIPQTLYRTIINLKSQTVLHEQLDDRAVEFPRIKEDIDSLAHRYIYMPTRTNTLEQSNSTSAVAKNALIKYDVDKKSSEIHDFGSHCEIDEAVFAPKANCTCEDDGYLMLFCYNNREKNSEFVILDAQNLKAEPLARIKMPRRVPHGLHGSWMSEN